jgi:YfiH family protein
MGNGECGMKQQPPEFQTRSEDLGLNSVRKAKFLQLDGWKGECRIAHGFGTRHPGGDKPSRKDWGGKAVQEGREIFPLLSLRQVHGDWVVLFDPAFQTIEGIWQTEGDALITRTPGVALGVFTADCLPIFLYDPVQEAIGVVHTGWRGTAKGVIRKAVEKMGESFRCQSRDILAALGPCIGPCCYEVDGPVKAAFISGGIPWELVSSPGGDGKWLLNLYEANLFQMQEAGILKKNINLLKICTSCHGEAFFSYRNADKTGGRQLNFIALKKE